MKFALISQFYWPHIGGAQRVVQEVAEKLAEQGYEVEVLTSWHSFRDMISHNGVTIKSFNISGNKVNGLSGEFKKFQDYILSEGFDTVFIYAAQHWGFDCLLPILDQVKAKKVHIPCGYSSLNDPRFKSYYEDMKIALKKFDLLIYHSFSYQDYEFAKRLNLKNLVLIPNGASLKEFLEKPAINVKLELKISATSRVLLTIGSPPYAKGHLDVLKVFEDSYFDSSFTLILNGNYKLEGFMRIVKELLKLLRGSSVFNIYLYAFFLRFFKSKDVRIVNLSRESLISLLFEGDLFLFMSHVEYSPLVLFESVAAGLPFISTDCGNAREIASWTKGGEVVDKSDFVERIKAVLGDEDLRKNYSKCGRKQFLQRYNWVKICEEYLQRLKA